MNDISPVNVKVRANSRRPVNFRNKTIFFRKFCEHGPIARGGADFAVKRSLILRVVLYTHEAALKRKPDYRLPLSGE